MPKLRIICRDLTRGILGEPGTMIERMVGYRGGSCKVVKGEVFKVIKRTGSYVTLEGLSGFQYNLSYFKKASD